MESFLTMSSSTSENVTTSGRGKKRKASEYATSSSAAAAAAAASSYEPEPIKPEWLELSPELAKIDFQKESIAWNKFVPYSTTPVPCVEIGTGPAYTKESPALCFQLHAICGRARAATLHFPNAVPPIPTPRFMPGTKGTLKGVLPEEIQDCDCPMILANTYHLAIQPGTELIDTVFGGLPNFMGGVISDNEDKAQNNGKRRRLYSLLTDSGGFQMVSLASLSQVTEDGVVFESPYTKGEVMKLRPEDSIKCQNEIGADVIMQLDDVVSSVQTDRERFLLATLRTLRWFDRCVQAHKKSETQNLFPIMQGHLDISKGGLRDICLAGFRHRDSQMRIPGFAIGGLAGGESKDDFWKVVDHACRTLPDDRPRYLMGVGYPLDLVVCTALGVDQFDCVYPTRTARFGVALMDANGALKLKAFECAQDKSVIDTRCSCPACSRKISRERLHNLLKSNNPLAIQLLTQHNVVYMMGLVTRMRQAIIDQSFPKFCREFLKKIFNKSPIPQWVQDAMDAAGISL